MTAEKKATEPPPARNVYELIAAVSAEIAHTGIAKSRKNQQQGYNFRGIDEVYNALAPLVAKHKLVILPRILSRECVERTTQKGGVLFYVIVAAEFDFVSAEDGSKHTARTYGEAMDSADKATNKAMSAAYKYAAFQTFCIPTEGDNDADATTPDPIVPNAPEGYAEFAVDFLSVAEEGLDALRAAFKGAKEKTPAYVDYLTKHDNARYEKAKARATEVDKSKKEAA